MASYKGLLWSLVAIAGTATAAAVVYRYATRDVNSDEETEDAGTSGSTAPGAQPQQGIAEDDAEYYEDVSEDEELDGPDMQQQQLMQATREGNMLLSVFGLVMMLLVGSVSLIVTWTNSNIAGEEWSSPSQLPMFTPLMWIAMGIFVAASVDILRQHSVPAQQVPVLNDKAVFPHDEHDFELIERHSNSSGRFEERSAAGTPDQPSTLRRRQGRRSNSDANSDEEEKSALPLDLGVVIRRADELFDQSKHQETRHLLTSAIGDHPQEVELLWRQARACNLLVDTLSSTEEKRAMAHEGMSFAEQAYALAPNEALPNKWKGILTSTIGNFRDLKDKIAGAYQVRELIKRAIELDPSDPYCHNILGQWCLAFANMTWIEKRAAAALFGTPPTATYDDAVQCFLAAETARPGFWKQNAFLLGDTYYKMKQNEDARAWLAKARDLPATTREDEQVHEHVVALLAKLR